MNRVILFYEQWQVCNGSVLRFFAVATVYFSHNTTLTTLFGQIGCMWQLPFSIREKMCMISFNKRYVAGPESNQRLLDPQSDSLSMLRTQLQVIHEPPLRPAKTQISLCIRLVWSESSLSAWTNIWSSATHWAHYEDSDQTGRMPRLIWVFAGHKRPFCWFCQEVAHILKVHPYLR